MTLSETCIRRPVLTTLITASIIVLGIFAYRLLSVAALPAVDFPTIAITATLPGASAETMAASVAAPIERQLSTIAGITSLTSSSSLGITSITIQFDLNRSIDGAALDVQTALSVAQRPARGYSHRRFQDQLQHARWDPQWSQAERDPHRLERHEQGGGIPQGRGGLSQRLSGPSRADCARHRQRRERQDRELVQREP